VVVSYTTPADVALSAAVLSGANLSGAALGATDLSQAVGLEQQQIARALGLRETKLSPDLHVPDSWVKRLSAHS
jgi:uncharacterized protein YjbI with pentapeptide repeats